MFYRSEFFFNIADGRNKFKKTETKYPIDKRNGCVLVIQVKIHALISCLICLSRHNHSVVNYSKHSFILRELNAYLICKCVSHDIKLVLIVILLGPYIETTLPFLIKYEIYWF